MGYYQVDLSWYRYIINYANNATRTKKLAVKEFTSKFRDKEETYNFMALDVDTYLPEIQCVITYFFRDMISKKMWVKASQYKSN